jgi:hypothetical protein
VCRFRAYCLAVLAIGWSSASACSVFPDRALLPESDAAGAATSGAAGSLIAAAGAGTSSGGSALSAGQGGDLASSGNDAGGDAGDTAGAAGAAQAAGGDAQVAGSDSGGASGCNATHVLVSASADTWIDAAQPQVTHGTDTQLFVLGGANERRALIAFNLPAAKAVAGLVSAALVLTLDQPPNLGTSSRTLNVYPLEVAFNEARATWLNYANGASKTWATPGGDFSATFGTGALQPGDTGLRLDVSALVAAAYSSKQSALGLLVRDPQVADPVNFAFVSQEGVALARPVLDIERCPP